MLPLLLAVLLRAQAAADDEAAARGAVEAVVSAMNANKPAAFAGLFDLARLGEEIRSHMGDGAAALPPLDGPLRVGLGASVAQQHQLGEPWGAIRAFRLKLRDGEAEAACILRSDDGLKERLRFWLVRRPDGWRVYDFESVADGLRVSVVWSAFLAQSADPAQARATRKAALAFRMAMTSMAQGELDAALGAVEKIDRAVMPAALAPFFDLIEGVLLADLGRPEEALERLDRSLARKPDLPRAWRAKSEICLELERYESVVKAEQAFLEIIPDDPEAFLNLGEALRQLGKTEEAEKAFGRGIACDPEDVENRLRLGLLLASRGREAEAKERILEALTRSEDGESDYARVAEELVPGPAAGLLLDLATEEAKARPDAVEPLYHKGLALRRLGRFEEAETALRRGQALDEEAEWTAELLEELACVLGHRGRREEAQDLAGRLSDEVGEAAGLYVEAYLHALAGEQAAAATSVGDALRADPDLHAKFSREAAFEKVRADAPVRDALAAAKAKSEYASKALDYLWQERHEALRALAEARTAAAPDDTDAWHDLGRALRRLGRHDAAEKALRAGLGKETADARRPRFWEDLGQALARSGRPREALEWSAKLLAEEDWQAEGHAVAAAAHAFLDDRPAALASLSKLLEADPDAADAVAEDPAFQELRGDPGYAALLERARRSRSED